MANDGAITGFITVEKTGYRKNFESQYSDRTSQLQNFFHTSPNIGNNGASLAGEVIRQSQDVTPSEDNHAGFFSTDVGGQFFFERVWVQPELIAKGFITEESVTEVKIWNAFRAKTVQVTTITSSSPDGTVLVYPTPLPDTIPIFGDVVYTLIIEKDGPPLQDTSYIMTIGGNNYQLDITGIRIIPFDLDPNWDKIPEIQYEFNTTIFTTNHFQEQRRPLSDEAWIGISAEFDVTADRARKVFNLLSYAHDKILGVPIYHEKMKVNTATQGTTVSIVDEDMTYYYNSQNTSYFMLVDHESGLSEIKAVASLSAPSTVNFQQQISGSFDLSNTYMYPCVFCVLGAYRADNRTDDVDTVGLEFKEFKSG